MKALRSRIADAAKESGGSQVVIEKDYALSYVLAGLVSVPALSGSLVFKGGTALKKAYFGDYRFSEDLDFTALDAPTGPAMDTAVAEAVRITASFLDAWGPFSADAERYTEHAPHPAGQDAFVVRIAYPWQREPLCRVKLEITHDEPVLLAPERRTLIHGYGEDLDVSVLCYRLEEIVAEKLRTLLQTQQRLVARGWNRPRARDYYDLWRLFGRFGDELDRAALPGLLEQKCAVRGVSYISVDDFFTDELVAEAHRHWTRSLGPFVASLPECDVVLNNLHSILIGLELV